MGRTAPRSATPSYFGQSNPNLVSQVKTPATVTPQNGGYQPGAAMEESAMPAVDTTPLATPPQNILNGGSSDTGDMRQLRAKNNLNPSGFGSRLPFYGSF